MPQPGDVYALGPTEHLTLTTVTPELLELEATWEPSDAHRPLLHRHPSQDEHFVVHEGELTALVGGVEHVLRAGDTLDVPRGTPHSMHNAGARTARATWQVRPALRTAQLWSALDAIGRAGDGAQPTPEEGAALLQEYAPEFELVF
jgi:mannose-6-phosphate isomerase-like protein (cupin superfamily)